MTTTSTTTELVDGALHQRAKGVDVTEVRRHPDGLAAEPAQVLRGLLAGVGFAAGNHDAGAGQNETLRQRQADSSGTTRHDDGATGHVEEVLKDFAIHAVSRTDRDSTPRTAQRFERAGR